MTVPLCSLSLPRASQPNKIIMLVCVHRITHRRQEHIFPVFSLLRGFFQVFPGGWPTWIQTNNKGR